DRASARDRPLLRSHPGDGRGPHRRGRHARDTRCDRRALCTAGETAVPERVAAFPATPLACAGMSGERGSACADTLILVHASSAATFLLVSPASTSLFPAHVEFRPPA